MVVFFVLVVLIVQIGFLVASRSMIGASVDASARRLSWSGAGEGEAERLRTEIASSVPGADIRSIDIARSADRVAVHVEYTWTPPGPDLVPITMSVERTRALVVPP